MRLTTITVLLFAALACARQTSPSSVTNSTPTPAENVAAPTEEAPSRALLAKQPLSISGNSKNTSDLNEARELARVGEVDRALRMLSKRRGAPARYVRARVLIGAGRFEEAAQTLARIETQGPLNAWVQHAKGELARGLGDEQAELRALESVFESTPALARDVTVRLAELRAKRDPESLWEARERHEGALDPNDVDARARFIGALIRSVEKTPREGVDPESLALDRFVHEPVSGYTPAFPPRRLTSQERIERAEALLAAHRNEQVLKELTDLGEENLDTEWQCRRDFAHGLAARKLRRYREARTHLGQVIKGNCDSDLQRRAHYLWAKVISIAAGLAAIEPIEQFAKTYAGHTMVDDVLFWAGDMYQRRGRSKDAERYYRRIGSMTPPGDQCAISRWRLAWMSYRAKQFNDAKLRLARLLENDGCVDDAFDRARASYWLGRVAELQGDGEEAIERFSEALSTDPFGFYAQIALSRIRTLDSPRYAALSRRMPAPSPSALPELCPGPLADDPVFLRGWSLYTLGLYPEAASEWLTVRYEPTPVLSGAHATALGKEAAPLEVAEGREVQSGCSEEHPGLLLALLLSQTGEKAEAQWRLRTTYAPYFARSPTAATAGLWLAAFPLEAREFIAPAEQEAGLPSLFLQALSREESAFDDQVVSWAGAYGLTQLLLSTGQTAGRLLEPPVLVTEAEQLLDPGLNARLGAAYLGRLMGRYDGHPALALAAYNAGESVADTWWQRHAGDDLDVFAEEMTIKETRGYVKRVLRTYGIYRWLYDGAAPVLPAPAQIPSRKTASR